ncbi:MAG: GAP family protein [Micrococcales bacterium]|nr:GAP family protein [Micrococcales bacterium]
MLILGTPRARANGPAFALGWIMGLTIVSVVVVLLAGGADGSEGATSTALDWLKLALGVLFLGLGVKQWRGRPDADEEAEMPGWMASLDSIKPGKAFLLGSALSGVNPKNLALTLAAAASIAQAGLSAGGSAAAIAVFVVLGSLTVAGPALFFLLSPSRATGPLNSVKDLMTRYNTGIMLVLFLVLGAKLIGNGIAGLT